MRLGAIAAHIGIDVNLLNACRLGDAAHFRQQARGIAFAAALRNGDHIVDMDMAAAHQIDFFAKTAHGHGIGFAFFENAQQTVALAALQIIHLFDKAVDIGEHGAQHAQCAKRHGRFTGFNLTQHAAGGHAGLLARGLLFGALLLFNRLRQRHFRLGRRLSLLAALIQ